MRFLMSRGLGEKRLANCCVTSFTSILWARCFRSFMIRTIHAYEQKTQEKVKKEISIHTSVWCLRSSSIRSLVSFLSSPVSTLATTVLILIFCMLEVNWWLKEKESLEFTSRLGGCFFNILNFAHASDCRWRRNSFSGIWVADLIS